jgi:AraC-like DNA-binding protein
MRKNQTLVGAWLDGGEPCVFERPGVPQPEHAQRMRRHLGDFMAGLSSGGVTVRLPRTDGAGVARGDGHFHLAPELFLQVAGWTRFAFPRGELRLAAGEALLLPPKLLHAETVGASTSEGDFCNLVVYAEGATLSCHIAHEPAPGRPGILHLEASRHPQAARIQDWLSDAVRAGRDGDASPLASAQLRALVVAATAGVLRALDDPDPVTLPEPPLVARARVLVQNQLGDQHLSVRLLAEQSGCTPDYLSHLFARATGEHLVGFITRQRMERALHLLGESAMASKEIAWACGFATQSYFIRSFREHFGLTPKVWRAARQLGH